MSTCNIYDVVVVGSGPASYSAAIYLLNSGVRNIILYAGSFDNGIGPGGQLTTTTSVDNYPGFPTGTQGPDLMKLMENQAKDRNLKIVEDFIVNVEKFKDETIQLTTEKDEKLISKTVIVGTGATARKLIVPGSEEYWQKGISACAVCDGFLFMKKVVVVIGGGDTAIEEVNYLSQICSKVYLIHRRDEFRARADNLEKARRQQNVEIITQAELFECKGKEGFLDEIVYIKNKKEKHTLKVSGLFFAIGHVPNNMLLAKSGVELESNGYAVTNKKMETNVRGIYCCGDIQDFKYRQAVTASSSGVVAAINVCNYLQNY